MWITPFRCFIDSLQYNEIESFEIFHLFRQHSVKVRNLITKHETLNKKYIIVMKDRNKTFIVAVSMNKEGIYKHWDYIKDVLYPQTKIISKNLGKDLLQKIDNLSIQEEDDHHQNGEIFHRLFDTVLLDEKLITSFEGSWEYEQRIQRGIMFISENNICFSGDDRYIIHFRDIFSIEKKKKMLISKSIKFFIYQRDSIIKYSFSTSNHDHAYDILERLWAKHLDLWQHELEIENEQNQLITDMKDSIPTNYLMLEKDNIIHIYNQTFKVNEPPLDYIESSLYYNETLKRIELYISKSYLCFNSSDVLCVINYRHVKNVSYEYRKLVIEKFDGRILSFIDVPIHFYEIIKKRSEKLKSKHGLITENKVSHEGYKLNEYYIELESYELSQKELISVWDKYFEENSKNSSMVITEKFEFLLKNGVPDIYRGLIWQISSGSIYQLESNPGLYEHYLNNIKPSDISLIEIDKDLKRSLPTHPFYKDDDNIEKLRRILIAYTCRNPKDGYCQGMNIVASIFLLYMNEEEAFWMLTTLVEKISLHYYNKNLFGTVVDQKILWDFVAERHERIFKIIDSTGLPATTLTLSWFICLFVDRLPWKSMLYIIDLLLFHGTKILFQTSLHILQLLEDNILKEKRSEMIPMIIKEHPIDEITDKIWNIDIQNDMIYHMRYKYRVKTLKKLQRRKGKKYIQDILLKYPSWEINYIEDIFNKYLELGKGNSLSIERFRAMICYFYPNINNLMNPQKSKTEYNSLNNNELESIYNSLISGIPSYQSDGENIRYIHVISSFIPKVSSPNFRYDIYESEYFLYKTNTENQFEYWSNYKGKEFVDKIYSFYTNDNDDQMDFKMIVNIFNRLNSNNIMNLYDFCKDIILSNQKECSVHQLYEIFLVLYHLSIKDEGLLKNIDNNSINSDLKDFAKSIFELNNISFHDGHEFTRIDISKVDEALNNHHHIKSLFNKFFLSPKPITEDDHHTE